MFIITLRALLVASKFLLSLQQEIAPGSVHSGISLW